MFVEKSHVLLWSGGQNSPHVETLEAMISNNRSAYRDDRRSDWIVIGVGTHDECSKLADAVRGTLRGRDVVAH